MSKPTVIHWREPGQSTEEHVSEMMGELRQIMKALCRARRVYQQEIRPVFRKPTLYHPIEATEMLRQLEDWHLRIALRHKALQAGNFTPVFLQ